MINHYYLLFLYFCDGIKFHWSVAVASFTKAGRGIRKGLKFQLWLFSSYNILTGKLFKKNKFGTRLSLKQTKLLPNHKRFVHVFGERLQEDWVLIIKDKEAKKGFCTASNR